MRNDSVDGKNRRSPRMKSKTDLFFNKKLAHDSEMISHTNGLFIIFYRFNCSLESDQVMNESITSKVIIVDEDPSTPIDDIAKSHGISFFYDQRLENEHQKGNEMRNGEKSNREKKKKPVMIGSDSGSKMSHMASECLLSKVS